LASQIDLVYMLQLISAEGYCPARSAALRALSPGGSATVGDQLANARPAARIRAAFVSGGALPFAGSCLRLVVSFIWRWEARAKA
jgi:hypothetical protein